MLDPTKHPTSTGGPVELPDITGGVTRQAEYASNRLQSRGSCFRASLMRIRLMAIQADQIGFSDAQE